MVIGPAVNEQTLPTIVLYLRGQITAETCIQQLLPKKLEDQYTFKTPEALRLLHALDEIGADEITDTSLHKAVYFVTEFYDTQVTEKIIQKYGLDPMTATRRFLTSETHAILEDVNCGAWMLPDRAIFDMWEAEVVTGDPRNSIYVRAE